MTVIDAHVDGSEASRVCDACLRRTWLVARLANNLEIARHQRRPLREVLALEDETLIAALAGGAASAVSRRLRSVSTATMRETATSAGLLLICRHDTHYPARLSADRAAPPILHVAGPRRADSEQLVQRFDALLGSGVLGEREVPTVAIVGTRRATDAGLEVARVLGRGLCAAGVTVISGMALGIDSAAHAGAVESGGRTVAVLASGADVPSPRNKRTLYERIRLNGIVVSEMPPGFRPYKWSFPARNRTIAALADATIIVEAAERSGSLITAELALELGRDVGAVPGPVLSWRSHGTNALLRDGATLIRDTRDALDLVLGVDAGAAAAELALEGKVQAPPDLSAELNALLSAVEDGPDAVAAMVRTASNPQAAATVRAGLTELELLGLIRRIPGGRYMRTAVGL